MTAAFLSRNPRPHSPRRFADTPSVPEDRDDLASDERAYARAFLAGVSAALTLLDGTATDEGLPDLTVWEMVRVLETALTERGQATLIAAFVRGASAARERLPRDARQDARLAVAFDLVNDQAVTWAAVHSARMVTSVADETRQALRAAITRALARQTDPRQLAREIRALVGLTRAQAQAVDNLRAALLGEGRNPKAVERIVGRYARRLLRYRAETIARTEIQGAANRGAEALWRQVAADGLLDADAWERTWLVARDERLCPICRSLGGTRAPLAGGTFPGGFVGPPAHPRCRCAQGLVGRRA